MDAIRISDTELETACCRGVQKEMIPGRDAFPRRPSNQTWLRAGKNSRTLRKSVPSLPETHWTIAAFHRFVSDVQADLSPSHWFAGNWHVARADRTEQIASSQRRRETTDRSRAREEAGRAKSAAGYGTKPGDRAEQLDRRGGQTAGR